MPASGTMSRSSAAAIEVWARARPSHTCATLEARVFFTAPMVCAAFGVIYVNRKGRGLSPVPFHGP